MESKSKIEEIIFALLEAVENHKDGLTYTEIIGALEVVKISLYNEMIESNDED